MRRSWPWQDVLPLDVASEQERWEWEQSVVRALAAGAPRQLIARIFGGERRLKQFEQRMLFERARGRKAPVIVYFEERRPSDDEAWDAHFNITCSGGDSTLKLMGPFPA